MRTGLIGSATRLVKIALTSLLLVAGPITAQTPKPNPASPVPSAKGGQAQPAATATVADTSTLTKADVDSWLDGLIP